MFITCLILTKIIVCQQILIKLPSINFHENPSIIMSHVQTNTDMAQLIGVFLQLLIGLC
jgi:hypothetical protein